MIDQKILQEIENNFTLAEKAEAKNDFISADGYQTQVDVLVLALVKRYYGAMPIKTPSGDWVMTKTIKTVLETFMPGSVYINIA